jgi:hypothetical protein
MSQGDQDVGLTPTQQASGPRVTKTQETIAAKAQEVYELIGTSDNPINSLGLQSTLLRESGECTASEAEKVSTAVMSLLIRYGWKKAKGGMQNRQRLIGECDSAQPASAGSSHGV